MITTGQNRTPTTCAFRSLFMKGFVQDIESLGVKNDEFLRVLYTAKHCQLDVVM